MNIAESEAIRAIVGVRDMVVVNSCAVTNDAVAGTRRAIRRARRERPLAELVVTGCAAQIDPASFAAMPEVTRVIGNSDKLNPAAWASTDPVIVRDIGRVLDTAPQLAGGFDGQTRAFVEVQNGCDHRCTFCAIPAGRGPSRSADIGAIVAQVASLVAASHNEVVLTGVDLSSYGDDLPTVPRLGDLVEAILTRTALRRLRLSSLDPANIDGKLLELLTSEPRIMPHVHLSFQAGDDMVLKRMKRRHLRADAVRLVERLKASRDIAIGADLIAGFPTEDDAMAANSLSLIDACDIVHAHIFPYSPRGRTPAARMPQVPPPVAKARAERLRAAAARRHAAWAASLVGSDSDILVERPGTRGHTPGFADVTLLSPCAPGTIVRARLTQYEGDRLIGMPL